MKRTIALLFIALLFLGILVTGCAPDIPEEDFDMEDPMMEEEPGDPMELEDDPLLDENQATQF